MIWFSDKSEDEIKALLKARMNAHRYEHSLNVAARAVFLAERNGADPERAYFAGLVHDICKGIPLEEQHAIIEKAGIVLDEDTEKSPALWHAVAGSVYIQTELSVTDEDIIRAVRYHTTGRGGMSLLEKVLYMADLTSADRNYPDADYTRSLTDKSLAEGLAYGVRWLVNDLKNKGLPTGNDTAALFEEMKSVIIHDDERKNNMESKELAIRIAKILDSKKAIDIRVLKICDISALGDYFIIASASNKSHVQSLSDELDFTLGHENGIKPKRVEGYSSASWILMDYESVIVHIFHEETREFYSLERLWSDAKVEEIDFSEE